MNKSRLDVPLMLGILAGVVLTSYWVIAAIVADANMLVIPIIITVGVVGSGIGIFIGWLFRAKVIKKR